MAFSLSQLLSMRGLNRVNPLSVFRGHGFTYSKINMVLKSDIINIVKSVEKGLLVPKTILLHIKANNYSSYAHDSTTQYDYFTKEIIKTKTVSPDIIDNLRQVVKAKDGNINDYNFDAMFVEICRLEKCFSLGKDFFLLLYSQKKCNLATIGKFFRLCYDFPSECTEDDKSLLVKIYRDLLVKYSVLDARTCENLALGLTITSEWKEGLNLIKMNELSGLPSMKLYSAVIQAAFNKNESEIAKNLLNEMATNKKNPPIEVYEAWLKSSELTTSNAYYQILKFIETYDIHPSENIAKLLLDMHNKLNGQVKHGAITNINHTGRCNNCQSQLKRVSLTQEEFLKLRSAFLDPVLIGKDVFLKTKPEELDMFFSFIRRIKKVDFVLDGLNIAFSKENNTNKKTSASQNFKLSHSAAEAARNICKAFGEGSVNERTICRWFAKFSAGDTDLENQPRGRPPSVIENYVLKHFLQFIKEKKLKLSSVVKHFVMLEKRVAVIGRKHMQSWPKTHLKYIMENSELFLAENVSADDPYLLYTTMHSGLGTYFVSRDQMRSHKFLLKDADLRGIFSRWQQMHQYYLSSIGPPGKTSFVKPPNYIRSPQESQPGVWHIPISTSMDGVLPHQVAGRTPWLCLN